MDEILLIKEILFDDRLVQIAKDRDCPGNYITIVVGSNGEGKSRMLRDISVQASVGGLSKKTICISNAFFNKFVKSLNRTLSFKGESSKYDYNVMSIYGYRNLCLSEIYSDNISYLKGIDGFVSRRLIDCLLRNNRTLKTTHQILNHFLLCDNVSIELSLDKDMRIFKKNEICFDFDRVDRIDQTVFFKNHIMHDISSEIRQNICKSIEVFIHEMKYMDILTNLKNLCFNACGEVDNEFVFNSGGHSVVWDVSFPDYLNGNYTISEKLRDAIIFLNNYNLFQIKNISFKKGAHQVNVGDLSSGELNILFSLLSINSEIEDGSLILIDEPELSLHPKWQSEIIPKIMESFNEINGCHFVIATHSPLVVSSIPKSNSSVVILDSTSENNLELIYGREISGKSSDSQLFNILNFMGSHNEYLIRILMTIIAKRTTNARLSNVEYKFLDKAEELIKVSNVKDDDPVMYLFKQAKALL